MKKYRVKKRQLLAVCLFVVLLTGLVLLLVNRGFIAAVAKPTVWNAIPKAGRVVEAGKEERQDNMNVVIKYEDGAERIFVEMEKGARLPPDRSVAIAEFEQGKAYRTGRGVEKNEAEALRWFRKSAEHGHCHVLISV